MNQVEERLDRRKFLRIHRSTMVSAEHVVKITPTSNYELKIELDNGKELVCSKSYSRVVRKHFDSF